MIAFATKPKVPDTANWQGKFLEMMPTIENHARAAFRGLTPDRKEDAVAEIVASTIVAFARLVDLGKSHLAYPSVLARYGVAQFLSGRRTGTRTNTRDVASPAAQRKHGFKLTSLNGQQRDDEDWKTFAVEDRSSTPADTAAFRIDFEDWTQALKPRYRRIAADLGNGHSTSTVARKHSVSPGRVSQIRKELESSWSEFQSPTSSKSRTSLVA